MTVYGFSFTVRDENERVFPCASCGRKVDSIARRCATCHGGYLCPACITICCPPEPTATYGTRVPTLLGKCRRGTAIITMQSKRTGEVLSIVANGGVEVDFISEVKVIHPHVRVWMML